MCWSGEGWGSPWNHPAATGSGVDLPAPALSAPVAALGSAVVPPAEWCWGCRCPKGPSAGRDTAPHGSWWDLGSNQQTKVTTRHRVSCGTAHTNLMGPTLCVCVCMHACNSVCVPVCVYMCTCTCVCAFACVWKVLCVCVCVCVCVLFSLYQTYCGPPDARPQTLDNGPL